jgi:hypothetical protein
MTKLEQHRKTWQGKSDEWLFERLANELTQKVEEIHKLLAENEQLRLYIVSNRRELLIAYEKNHYTPVEWVLASEICIKEIDEYLSNL